MLKFDKKKIFSVIYNRLQKNMKLQIDATTIFAITEGFVTFKKKSSGKSFVEVQQIK